MYFVCLFALGEQRVQIFLQDNDFYLLLQPSENGETPQKQSGKGKKADADNDGGGSVSSLVSGDEEVKSKVMSEY